MFIDLKKLEVQIFVEGLILRTSIRPIEAFRGRSWSGGQCPGKNVNLKKSWKLTYVMPNGPYKEPRPAKRSSR